ncbi:MAG: glycosyltransferase family 2 protein [Clostridia bacterium]|nr:glycosyltransferase family 2 protein [Clostridia bacterium]
MNATHPFFSIIVPVHNGSKTLENAIVSILTQTFSDYELLIIENASTDNSLDIARAYEKKFDRVRVFHSDKRGQSLARNIGIENARGEYIVFLDADDLYKPNALNIMHSALEKERADVLIAGFTNYPLDESDEVRVVDGRTVFLAMLDPTEYYSRIHPDPSSGDLLLRHQSSRAYRRELIEQKRLRFNENCPMYVDLTFNEQVYPQCKTALLVFKKLYLYNKTNGSIVNRLGVEHIIDAIPAFEAQSALLDAVDAEATKTVCYTAFIMLCRMVAAYVDAPSEEGLALLTDTIKSDAAKRVLGGVRRERLHLLPDWDDAYKGLLSLLINGDISAATAFVKAETARRALALTAPTVSVITPVYNAEKYIERCVESLRAQTFYAFEAIFVDDASTDGSYERLMDYSKADRRIRVIRQQTNAGQGAARNIGIDTARGKYLAFLDADDAFAPDFLELLVKKAEETGAEVVKGAGVYITDEQVQRYAHNKRLRDALAKGVPLAVCFRAEHWSAIYRRDFINKHSVRYGDSRCGQDTTFLLKVCAFAKTFETEDGARYMYYQNAGSTVRRFDEARFKGTLDALSEQLDFIRSGALTEDNALKYVKMNARFLLGMHSYMLSEELPEAEAFGKRLCDVLARFEGLEKLKKADYALNEFMVSGGSVNIDPTLTVIGLDDTKKVRFDALKRLKAHIADQTDTNKE